MRLRGFFDNRAALKAKDPTLKINLAVFSKQASQAWKSAVPSEKEKYDQQAKANREAYYAEHPEKRPVVVWIFFY